MFAAHLEVMVPEVETEMSRSRKLSRKLSSRLFSELISEEISLPSTQGVLLPIFPLSHCPV